MPQLQKSAHILGGTLSKTILIVDDSAVVRATTLIALKGAGYEVIPAVDGVDALSKLDGQKIHLIISDVHMPTMDGITFVKEAKKRPAYQFTPVIMLTNESQETLKQESLAAGAKAWLIKPFHWEQILAAEAAKLMTHE
jgi:two-component system chemotaxis response regulator CheY